jgi:hypothetical protein
VGGREEVGSRLVLAQGLGRLDHRKVRPAG